MTSVFEDLVQILIKLMKVLVALMQEALQFRRNRVFG